MNGTGKDWFLKTQKSRTPAPKAAAIERPKLVVKARLTNRNNFPEALVKAMQNDSYDKGDSDFTATSLIKPARQTQLEKRHAHEIDEDVEDGLYRLYGQVAHGILERANMADLAEKRFFISVEVGGKKYKVSAQLDTLSLSSGVLTDYKFTTSWGFKKSEAPKADWIAQLNIQLECIRQNGFDASALQIVGLLRDWRMREAKHNDDYPQAPIATHDIPIWSRAQTISYIKMRIAAHLDAKRTLPDCDDAERWMEENKWAVTKKGQKRAINGGVQFSEEAAQKVQDENPGTFIQFRPGESVRCESYCQVAQFCSQFKRIKNKTENDSESESA